MHFFFDNDCIKVVAVVLQTAHSTFLMLNFGNSSWLITERTDFFFPLQTEIPYAERSICHSGHPACTSVVYILIFICSTEGNKVLTGFK